MSLEKKSLKNLPKYDDWLNDHLRDREKAILYLQTAFDDYQKDNEISCLLLAMRDVIKAQSSMTKIAKKTGLNRESLYSSLSKEGNPQFSTIWAILNALELHLIIKPIQKAA